ncbi:MAG TPA: hypothetical protein VE961_16530 [Pyrinomonadaceae bacterium]|nr:hypothetical protein [Pyrinomonadaceae bacterium]
MRHIEMRIRILEAYVVVSLLAFGVIAFSAFAQTKQKIDELTVERLNVVEKNGQLVAVLANSDRLPDPITNGKAFKTERPPGMIFYNGEGDECGGLVFGAASGAKARAGDRYGAYGGFTLDQYQQSQAIGLIYNDHSGTREVGLKVWDRPETPQSEFVTRGEAIRKMADGPEKQAARKSLNEANFSPTRIFVGKNKEREAKVTLYDARGNARINMMVDAAGIPRLDFLDEKGKVTYSLPGNAKPDPPRDK